MNDFHDALLAHGLRPRGPVQPDGKWHRCPTETHPGKRNGAWKWALDGTIGWFMDWATDTEPAVWRPDAATEVPEVDYLALKRRREKQEAKQQRAIQAARAFYYRSSALVGGHAYLSAKGLDMTGCRGLRVDSDGWLVVPMGKDGELMSVQRIAPDGTKRFWPGAPTTAARYQIDRPRATLTVLCEGLATGLALFAAVPHSRVIVTFTAGNLTKVARDLPRRGMACVAADNDHGTAERIGKNPGIVAAKEAANALGCSVAIPVKIEGTDFCDLRLERFQQVMDAVGYGQRAPTESEVRRAIDGEIKREIMQAAVFLPAVSA